MPEANKNKPKPKAKLYFGNADELAKTNNYLTPEYLQEVDKRRNDWNEFVQFLKKENVAGSENLDKSGAGLGYLKKWNKANPDKSFTEEDIKDVQRFSRTVKKQEGVRVNDGVLGKVTSTFTFPDSKVNTYEMKDGKKVLVKSEEPNIGNYQYQADKINFGIAAKNKADVSKLPIYNKNSATTNIDWNKDDATASNLLKEQVKKRSLSGQSLSNPNKFVKPLVATENHPAVQEQLEGSYFDNNQKVVDYNQNLQQQKQAEIQKQIDTRSALQKKLDTSKGKDFTKEEALDYFNETGKILPQNKVQGKYAKDKQNQIVDVEGNPYKTTKVIKTPGKFEFKNYGKNTWDIASGAIKDFANFGQSTFDVTNPIDAVVGPIITEAVNTPVRLATAATAPITGVIASTKIKLPKKKSITVTNEEFGMPTFQEDNQELTKKRQGGVIGKYQEGGKVNTLEGDLISKVIMNRNRDKNFVNRAYALGQNPGMFSIQDPENFGDVMSHKMAWGTDDSGQAYMYPTIMNNNNEAIKVPNQYADYISSEGYKKETNMEYGKGGYTVKRSSDRKGKTHVVIGPDGTKKYFGDPNLGERGKSKYGKEAFYARHKKNLDANPYFRAYARATWEDGGMIPEQGHITMNKKRSLFTYGGLTVTDLNKYELGGIKLGNNSSTITPSESATKSITGGTPTPTSTGAAVGGLSTVANAIAPGAGAVVPILDMMNKYTSDEYGAPKSGLKGLHNRANPLANINRIMEGKDVGRSLLGITGLGAISEATGLSKAIFGESDYDKEARERKFQEDNANLSKRMNASENWGNSNINTSQEMQFAQGGMVLDYDDPNANAELELQETFQMPNGQVGMVDGPSHENGGIAVNLPEGTRIWSDKLRYGGKTFAKHTKPITGKIARLEKEIAKNPNNSEAKQNSVMLLNQQLDHYFDVQETNKEANEMKRTFKNGGMIKRADGSYSRRGLWDNIRANKGSGKKPTPQMLEQERKINNEMAMGGMLTKYQDGDMVGNIAPRTNNFAFKFNNRTDLEPIQPAQITMQPNERATGRYGEFVRPQVPNPYANKPFDQLPIGVTRSNTKLNIGEFGANANRYIAPENLTMGDIGEATPGKTGEGFFNKAGQFIQDNPGLVGQLGTAAITAGAQMNRVNKLARPRTLGDVRLSDKVVNPNLVDYSAERQAYNRMGLNAMDEAQRGFGSSAAAQAFKNKARLNTLEGTGKSYQSQENTNAQIRNAANMARQEAAMREVMMNNEIDKYNLENVYGYDTMTTAQKNAITAMLGNTAGQAFGKQSDYANQLEQANILSNQYDPSVLNDMIKNGKLKVVDGKIVRAEYGGMMKRSFRNGGTNNPGFNALPEAVQENILDNMGMGGYMYPMGGRLMDEPMYAEGGIHIKPENKGKFTAYAKSHGKGVQEMASAVLANKENYSPTIVKRANFARNFGGKKK
jgi:hypothetical protein